MTTSPPLNNTDWKSKTSDSSKPKTIQEQIAEAFQLGYLSGCRSTKMIQGSQSMESSRIVSEHINWVTREQLTKDALKLAAKFPRRVGAIAGLPRSGLMVASIIATHLNLPLCSFNPAVDGGKLIQLGGGKRVDELGPQNGPVIFVDDSVNTGDSLACVKEFWPRARTAAVYVRPDQAKHLDYVGVEHSLPHWFEWHFFGSDLTEKCAFDMDGVICEDCPEECDDDGSEYNKWITNVLPKWLPRPHVIPKIVTSRLEKWRLETIVWLAGHEVQYEQLVMCPCETLEERSAFDICQFKADAVRNSNLMAFIESDPRQAKSIYQWSKKPCVCPCTGETFQ